MDGAPRKFAWSSRKATSKESRQTASLPYSVLRRRQMTVKDLEDLYDYGYWADRKLFDVISQLTPEEFTRSVAGSYESVRNTMVHVMSAEAGWLDRCGGPARGPSLNPVDFPTVESVTQAWNRVEANVREFLAKLKDEDLVRNVEFS